MERRGPCGMTGYLPKHQRKIQTTLLQLHEQKTTKRAKRLPITRVQKRSGNEEMQLIVNRIKCPYDIYQTMEKYDGSKIKEKVLETATNQA